MKHAEEAAAQCATLLGAGRDRNYRLYRLECGHEQEVQPSSMRVGRFRCQSCLDQKYTAEAASQGAELLGAGQGYHYRRYRLDCGHEQKVTTGSMRNGSFRCQTCEDTSRTLPSNVYLLHVKNGDREWLKLGYAKNVILRTSQYGLPETACVTELTSLRFDTGNEAHEFEVALHEIHGKRQISQRKAKALGMTKGGFAECYPMTMAAELLRDLAGVQS